MAAIGKGALTNEEDHVAIAGGLGSVPGEAGALAPGSARAHYHNPLGGFSGGTAEAAEEEIGGPFDDGDANKSADVGVGGGRGMAMEEMQGAVDQPTKGQALITGQLGLLIEDVAMNTAAQTPRTSKQVP